MFPPSQLRSSLLRRRMPQTSLRQMSSESRRQLLLRPNDADALLRAESTGNVSLRTHLRQKAALRRGESSMRREMSSRGMRGVSQITGNRQKMSLRQDGVGGYRGCWRGRETAHFLASSATLSANELRRPDPDLWQNLRQSAGVWRSQGETPSMRRRVSRGGVSAVREEEQRAVLLRGYDEEDGLRGNDSGEEG